MSNEKMLVDDMMLTELFEQAEKNKVIVNYAEITNVFDAEMFYSGENAAAKKDKIPKSKKYIASCCCNLNKETDSGMFVGSGSAAPDTIPKFEFLKFAPEIAIIRAKVSAFTLALESLKFKETKKEIIKPDVKEDIKEPVIKQEIESIVQDADGDIPSVQSEYTSKQIDDMKIIKKRLQIENDGLNQFMYEWSAGQLKTYKDLTPKNIDNFILFMNTNF